MYADTITDSMREAIDETERRRKIQMKFNEDHGIQPKTVRKAINDISSFIAEANETVGKKDRSRGDSLGHGAFFSPAGSEDRQESPEAERDAHGLAQELKGLPKEELARVIQTMEEDMRAASEAMDFEEAARLRDMAVQLKSLAEGTSEDAALERLRAQARKGSVFAAGRKRQGSKGKH